MRSTLSMELFSTGLEKSRVFQGKKIPTHLGFLDFMGFSFFKRFFSGFMGFLLEFLTFNFFLSLFFQYKQR